jgi:3-deoxy-manno-octulosonate cytidylyltransferase (CMP-KDO synthetase)
MREFTVIIPARYGASRLPGKPLLDLAGKPVIARVIERAQSSGAVQVVVATDDARIERAAITAGAKAVLTRADHPSGTDRIAEAVQLLGLPADGLIVNVQGDEPDMPAELIQQMASALAERKDIAMCTACALIEDAESIRDPNIVKVVRDQKDMALYFSRAPIPFARDKQSTFSYRRHIGIYAYRAAYITKFSAASVCELEQLEKLEQLRALHRGEVIYCPDAIKAPGPGVDTLSDLEQARAAWNA